MQWMDSQKNRRINMKIILIAAVSENGAIGKDNDLLWRLPDDMKFFKEKTLGQTIITGRKNYESIPEKFRPLPHRINIVVTRNIDYIAEKAHVVMNVQDAITAAKILGGGDVEENLCYIIGGGEIYNQTISIADEMYITRVHHIFEKADTFFPVIDEKYWDVEHVEHVRNHHEIDEKHDYAFTIYKYNKLKK